MRKILLILLLNLMTGSPVEANDAYKVVRNFIKEHKVDFAKLNNSNDLIETVSSNNIPIIYIFKLTPVGFVFIAADDISQPIIAYSFQNDFQLVNQPPNIKYIIGKYIKEIQNNINLNLEQSDIILRQWDKYLSNNNIDRNVTRDVTPLIGANFDQGCFWNQLCPLDEMGPCEHVWAGCGAVAMAQIMHYWQYPERGNGSYEYYSSNYGTLTADFENTIYDYPNMSNIDPTEAASLLIYHAAISLEMEFGPYVSWSYMWGSPNSIENSFPNFFYYDEEIALIHDYEYTDEEYIAVLKNELDNYRPMIYRGVDPFSGGHFWNIDGYQDNFFHCNWGWGGNANGYYALTSLSPGGSDFTNNQSALINIKPISCVAADINTDGIIDILDVVQIVDIIMDFIDATFYEECAADVNGDGIIDIFDIITIINIILE